MGGASLPNIVYLHSHDTGRYVAPYGCTAPTPRIARLAEEGVLFRQAFSAAPTCSPSRAALLTGVYPHECGMLGLAHIGFELADYSQHVAQILRGAGYRSALVGVQHVAADPAVIGYDEVVPVRSSHAADVAPAGAQWLAEARCEPFFLDVGFAETHRPFPAPGPEDDPRYVAVPTPLPDRPDIRNDVAAFHSSVRAMDAGIGTVLDALDAHGLGERTLVICTTDHGIAFPHMKCNLTDHGLGVMLVMRGPGGFVGGLVVDAMVSHVDLMPTMCELAGVDPPPGLRGLSLTPLVSGRASELHEELFGEVTYHSDYEPQRSVRTDRWKYIRRFDRRTRRVCTHCDDSPSRAALVAASWDEQPRDQEMLFDLLFDPQEQRNLVGQDRMQAVRRDLSSRLDRWMNETDDPLLRGPVPAPAEFLAWREKRYESIDRPGHRRTVSQPQGAIDV